MVERLKALKERSSLDFWQERDPRCPHCGNSVGIAEHELWELYSEGDHHIECPYCELDFTVQTEAKFSFTTEDQDED